MVLALSNHLKVCSCLARWYCDELGLARFDVLLELDGADLRREPLEVRKTYSRLSRARAATGYVATSSWHTTAG